MNNENKPLTAEEMFRKNDSRMCGSIHKGQSAISKRDIIDSMEEYATQQTAAKGAEIAKLREELSGIIRICRVDHFNGDGSALVAVGFRMKELDELSRWKQEQIATYAPLLDFGQSKESGLKVGDSIVTEAISALKYRKKLREELESVKKERDSLNERLLFNKDQTPKLIQAYKERDEAVKLMETLANGTFYHSWQKSVKDWVEKLKSRLSSGETKPVSPWISVEDRLPEPYTEVYAGSFDEDDEFGQTICWHTGEHWEGIEITADSMITHWAKKLVPPESLTDKP